MRLTIPFSILASLIVFAYPAGDAAAPDFPIVQITQSNVPVESLALNQSLRQLTKRHYSPYTQGIIVETLDGRILAEWNSDTAFNPASVLKLATSFMALSRLGAEHQFETSVYGDTGVDQKLKTLSGNLTIVSDGDPVFMTGDAFSLARALLKKGVRKVEGDLIFVGPFSMPVPGEITVERSADGLRRAFRQMGIQVKGRLQYAHLDAAALKNKVHFLSRRSPQLLDILWVQNAHSVNQCADRLGDSLGGAEVLRQFVLDITHVDPTELYVSKPSGLEHNRMSPHSAILLMRALYHWLEEHHLRMQDIMPVAGLDEGTLASRFRNPDFCGGILGKTGTNPAKDGGISSLAGLAYTRDNGPVFYAIFNSHGNVNTYRRWQDKLLQGIIEENGGVSQYLSGKAELVNVYARQEWSPSEYWSTLNPTPGIFKVSAPSKTHKSSVAAHGSKSSRTKVSTSATKKKSHTTAG
jgi:D-alanyl-D-alanine carboxypeptidase/D-alanyl-D-alanine-endopeptidase (penicillin-binding protein 4)